jgi:hypothetical protein
VLLSSKISFIFISSSKLGGDFVEWTWYLLNKLWIYYLSFKASHDFICFLLSLQSLSCHSNDNFFFVCWVLFWVHNLLL